MAVIEGTLIPYGIGKDYLPDWGYPEALREIYQNFEDHGAYWEDISEKGDVTYVRLGNAYCPPTAGSFLRMGTSDKRGIANMVGKHGEGLKMAALILLREDHDFLIYVRHLPGGGSVNFRATWYNDGLIGRCFGFDSDSTLFFSMHSIIPKHVTFLLSFTVPTAEFKKWQRNKLKDTDTVYKCYAGKIVDKAPGDVFVGGFFVANIGGLTRAYDFPPVDVPLDRDRKVPREFDILWAAGRILSQWEGTTPEDLASKDGRYVSSVTPDLAKSFIPMIDSVTGKADFSADGVRAPTHIAAALMKDEVVQKKVAKMRYQMTRKTKPLSILKEFRDRYKLGGAMRADFDLILRRAKLWKS